jgi:hypothetical protein
MDLFRNTNPHNPTHNTLFSINIDKTFMNPHLPPIPSRRSLTARRLQHGYLQPFRRQRNGTIYLHTGLLGDNFQLLTYLFEHRVIRARQTYPRFSNHRPSFLNYCAQTDLSGVYLRQVTANKNLSNKNFRTSITERKRP